jgi:hypothetical protein
MVGEIVLAAIGLWVFVCVLALGICKEAKAGDEAMEIACGRYRSRHADWSLLDQRQPNRPLSTVRRACPQLSAPGTEAGVGV